MISALARNALRVWGRIDKAPGYLYQVVERYGPSLASQDLLLSRLPNGCLIRCDLRDEVQRQMWFYGAYEPIEAHLFTRMLQPGMVVIDAGANVGQYSMLAATAVGPSGAVHSFEPVPATFARLREHITENGLTDVHLNRAALWNEDTTVTLGMPPDMTNNAGAYSIRAGNDQTSMIEAPGIRLDTYAEKQGLSRVDVIKMDIEGGEPFAISGGMVLIEKFHPIILMEVCRANLIRMGSTPAELWTKLSKLGYHVWRIGYSPQTCGPVSGLEGFEQGNALFHHAELPASVTRDWTYRIATRWARSGL